MIRILFFALLVLGFCVSSHSASFYQLQGAFRSFPRSGSGEAHVYYNEKLWTKESGGQAWNYGFWRVGAFAAIHGQAGLKVEVFPISIWQLSLQKSVTSRFYETQTLDCKIVECRGLAQRGTFKTSLALGYGDFFLIPSYTITDISLDRDKKDFSSEEDNLVADRAGDQLAITQFAFVYKMADQRWVIVNKTAKMKWTKDFSSSQLLVWNKTVDSELNYFVGAGTFESNHVDRALSLVAGINWSVGENLSLF